MPLSTFQAPKRKITFDGGNVDVRAVTLQDVAVLIDSHEYTISNTVAKVRSRQDLDLENPEMMTDIIMDVIRESPILAANIIALCADEPDQFDAAARLPLPVQIEIIQAIGELTFKDKAAVKKFAAGVKTMMIGLLPPTSTTPAQMNGRAGQSDSTEGFDEMQP